MATLVYDFGGFSVFAMRGGMALLRRNGDGAEAAFQAGDSANDFLKEVDDYAALPLNIRDDLFAAYCAEYFQGPAASYKVQPCCEYEDGGGAYVQTRRPACGTMIQTERTQVMTANRTISKARDIRRADRFLGCRAALASARYQAWIDSVERPMGDGDRVETDDGLIVRLSLRPDEQHTRWGDIFPSDKVDLGGRRPLDRADYGVNIRDYAVIEGDEQSPEAVLVFCPSETRDEINYWRKAGLSRGDAYLRMLECHKLQAKGVGLAWRGWNNGVSGPTIVEVTAEDVDGNVIATDTTFGVWSEDYDHVVVEAMALVLEEASAAIREGFAKRFMVEGVDYTAGHLELEREGA